VGAEGTGESEKAIYLPTTRAVAMKTFDCLPLTAAFSGFSLSIQKSN